MPSPSRSRVFLVCLAACPVLGLAARMQVRLQSELNASQGAGGTCAEPVVRDICVCNHQSVMHGYQCSDCQDRTAWGYGCDLQCPIFCASGCDFGGNCLNSPENTKHCKRNSRAEDRTKRSLNERGECAACERGFAGLYCQDPCPSNCAPSKAEGDCTRGGRCYSCKSGFFGEDCSMACPEACPNCVMKDNQVPVEGSDPLTYMPAGSCAEQCKGDLWGMQCEKPCPGNCAKRGSGRSSCMKDSGKCMACDQSIWWGSRCEEKCSDGCKGQKCAQSSGECLNGCEVGLWGELCEKPCGEGCGGACERETGTCSTDCKPGFWGDRCSSKCPPGTTEQGCRRENGMPYRCVEGRHPGHSKTTNQPACLPCPENCANNACHEDDQGGSCKEGCKRGFFGSRCEDNCPENCDGPCDHHTTGLVDGTCQACLPGWTGKQCHKECHATCWTCKQHGNAISAEDCTGCAEDEPVFLQGGVCECIPGASRNPVDQKCYCDEPDDPMKEEFFVARPAKECRWICKKGYQEVFGDKESICLTNRAYKAVVVAENLQQGSCQPGFKDVPVPGEKNQCIREDYIKNIIS